MQELRHNECWAEVRVSVGRRRQDQETNQGVSRPLLTPCSCSTLIWEVAPLFPASSLHCVLQVSAPEYMEYLFEWIEGQIDDERLFPVTPGVQFPPNFVDIVQKIFKRLFRVYGHIYHHHFKNVCALNAEVRHMGSCPVRQRCSWFCATIDAGSCALILFAVI